MSFFCIKLCFVDSKDTPSLFTSLCLVCPLITSVLSSSASFEIHLSVTFGRFSSFSFFSIPHSHSDRSYYYIFFYFGAPKHSQNYFAQCHSSP